MAGKKNWRNKTVQLHFRSSQHPSERTKSKHPRTKKANGKPAAPKGGDRIGYAPENATAADDLRPRNRRLAERRAQTLALSASAWEPEQRRWKEWPLKSQGAEAIKPPLLRAHLLSYYYYYDLSSASTTSIARAPDRRRPLDFPCRPPTSALLPALPLRPE